MEMTLQRLSAAFNPLDHPICLDMPRHVSAAGWHEHIPFAMVLVEMLRPKLFVELGVHTGDSYLAFCQAVATLNCGTACYGVDTWKGDAHAGFYGEEILIELRKHHDVPYGKFSRLIQSTFDEAASHFPDGTVSLLHIDGYHTYEAVRHDWEVWTPKMTSDGVVLFHDINVRETDFGVWRVWEELQVGRPHFAFKHAHGLGVLAVGSEVPEGIRWLFDLEADAAARVESLFFALGNRITLHAASEQLKKLLQEKEAKVEAGTAEAERLKAALETSGEEAKRLAAERDRSFATMSDLQAALDAMSRSSAVRASRMVRSLSPGLHRVIGSLGKALLPQNRP